MGAAGPMPAAPMSLGQPRSGKPARASRGVIGYRAPMRRSIMMLLVVAAACASQAQMREPVPPTEEFWCVFGIGPDAGEQCWRNLAECNARRMSWGEARYSQCGVQATAICTTYQEPTDGGGFADEEVCFPGHSSCADFRAVAARQELASTECEER